MIALKEQPIRMIRGSTRKFNIFLNDSAGEPYELQTDEVIRFGIKIKSSDTDYIIKKELTADDLNTENGAYTLGFTPDDTLHLNFGEYFYDVGVQRGTDYYTIIPYSSFVIAQNITSVEEA